MIRTLLVGVARSLFLVAMLAGLVAALSLYGAFRVLKSALGRQGGPPEVRDAGFAALMSLVTLARAIRDKVPAEMTELADQLTREQA